MTTINEPLLSLQDMTESSFGYHNRADWLKTTQKQQGTDTRTEISKAGMKVFDKDGNIKNIPN
jgi:hypothetical protein